ncbi:MAG: hypothetical protein K2O35_05710 [Clostridia bacterium]|nr:hypothetical protein [Clostridia bacterium]
MERIKSKIIIFLLTCITILLTLFSGAFCIVSKNNDTDVELSKLTVIDEFQNDYKFISPDMACEIVKSRVETIYCENIEIVKCDPIYNLDEELFGYEVVFETVLYLDKMIVLDTNNLDLLIYQFTLYTLKESNNSNSDVVTLKENNIDPIKKYIISPFAIGEYIGNNKIKFSENIINLETLKLDINKYSPKTLQNTVDDVIVSDYKKDKNFANWFGSGKQIKVKDHFITGALSFTAARQNELHYGAGNCGATAAYNILKYYEDCTNYNIFRGQSKDVVYSKVVNYMGKEEGTTIYQMAEGVTKYINNETSQSASFTHYVPPMWSYFKGDLDKNNPVLYTISASDGFHAMSALGYLEVQENKTILPKKFKFLIVASGWYSNLVYTNFDAIDWKLGCVIKVK